MGRNYANMRVYETPNQYSVPIQFAILRTDTRLAGLLLDNGAHRSLDGKNLAYYSAVNGSNEMARYFVSRGIGSSADISRAAREREEWRQRERQNAQMAGLIALGALGMMTQGGSQQQHGQRNLYGPDYTDFPGF